MTASDPSLNSQLRDCHEQLNELFLLHQEALLQGELANARVILASYEACHRVHMEFEDERLLPKYEELATPGRWDATLYRKEHRKIEDLYTRIEQGLDWLNGQPLQPGQMRRNIIQLLDREKSFKGLCEHHQEREEASLFVELDRQTDAHWRMSVTAEFSAKWQHQLQIALATIEALGPKG